MALQHPIRAASRVAVKALSFANDVGGTEHVRGVVVECAILMAFRDPEVGWRYLGRVVHQDDVEALRRQGQTPYNAAYYRRRYPGHYELIRRAEAGERDFDPSRVCFDQGDILEDEE